jgi:hypothetical protein
MLSGDDAKEENCALNLEYARAFKIAGRGRDKLQHDRAVIQRINGFVAVMAKRTSLHTNSTFNAAHGTPIRTVG